MDFPHYKFTVLYLGYSSSVTLSTYWICHSCTHSPHTNMHTLQNIFFVKHPIHSLLPVNRTLSMCQKTVLYLKDSNLVMSISGLIWWVVLIFWSCSKSSQCYCMGPDSKTRRRGAACHGRISMYTSVDGIEWRCAIAYWIEALCFGFKHVEKVLSKIFKQDSYISSLVTFARIRCFGS